MTNSVPPIVFAAIIAVVVLLVGFGAYKALAPPQYGADTHGGQPFGAHMPPAAATRGSGAAPH